MRIKGQTKEARKEEYQIYGKSHQAEGAVGG